MEDFVSMLSGGHPNSLGRTVEVVEWVLRSPDRIEELFCCYRSDDEVVRLRTSNAMKRLEKAEHALLVPLLDRFIEEVAKINQASAQWTIAQLFEALEPDMSPAQKKSALSILKRNLTTWADWIVLNTTMATLTRWALQDASLRLWLLPQLGKLMQDRRKSVAARAKKMQAKLAEAPAG